MSRNAKDTAATIFDRLVRYAADRGVQIPLGERYIFLDEAEYDILVRTKRLAHVKFGRNQAAALIKSQNTVVLAIAGFEAEAVVSTSQTREVEMTAGLAVAMLADLEVNPSASPASVLDVAGAGSAADGGYQGHDLDLVLGLYPDMQALEIDDLAAGWTDLDANLLPTCARQGAHGNGWVNSELAGELAMLGEQRIAGIPYEFLTRAVLDLNPTSLFLSLYRCLEATYAYTKASELATTLGISKPWIEIAEALGNTLSWYPRHDQGLAAVLAMPTVGSDELEALAVALGRDEGADALSTRVAAGVRELRNSLVHYGPTTRQVAILNDDWNALCIPLARVVGSVFAHAYAGDLPAVSSTLGDR
ncbi:Uncharacterised protein [Gordonia terrae]|nr:Uncharacterised protein [Gordonia terrae]